PPYEVVEGLTIVDMPHQIRNPNAPGTWTIEDCGICRTRAGQSVTDTVLGCVKFVFEINSSGVRSLRVQSAGGRGGKGGTLTASESPGRTWQTALQRWQTPGDQM